jgi:hypothetical protein
MAIQLPEFTRDGAILMLGWGATLDDAPITHREIAEL